MSLAEINAKIPYCHCTVHEALRRYLYQVSALYYYFF